MFDIVVTRANFGSTMKFPLITICTRKGVLLYVCAPREESNSNFIETVLHVWEVAVRPVVAWAKVVCLCDGSWQRSPEISFGAIFCDSVHRLVPMLREVVQILSDVEVVGVLGVKIHPHTFWKALDCGTC